MIGRLLGHYRLLERIGSGGMGIVFRARDERLNRDVALKLLPPDTTTDASARERLVREARHAAGLNHPNICTIFEVGETDDETFIAMELIDGHALAETIDLGLPPARLLHYAIPITHALRHAHSRGVIHRDLKSNNVMVTSDDLIKVVDFGLARHAPGQTLAPGSRSITETGAIVGTPYYLAPEVLLGDKADTRSDVWALGVLLYEMASGRLPFQGRTAIEIAAAVLHGTAPRLPDQVPDRIRTVIERCLEKDPARRYRDSGELAAALEEVKSGGPGTPSPKGETRADPPVVLPAWRWLMLAALAGVLLLIGLAFDAGGLRTRVLEGLAPTAASSLAVLPLENLSHDPEQDYFADGMTEELITELTKIGALRVIAASSVRGFRGSTVPAAEIARRLNVGAVVQGSVIRFGDRVRINARLVETRGQRQLWAESYERGLRDVIALQGEVALAIANGIKAQLTAGERRQLTRERPVDPDAYQDVLRGRYFLKRFTRDDFDRAQQYFERAIARDPAYAPAYAGIADRYYEASSVWLAPHDAIPRARAAALKALEIDSTLAEAHCTLGMLAGVYEVDRAAAEREFRKAIQLGPGNALIHQRYGYYLSFNGRHDEAIAELRHAVVIDPLSTFTSTYLGFAYHFARRYEDAFQQYRETIAMDTTFYLPRVFFGQCLIAAGQFEAGIRELEAATRLDDNLQGLSQKAWGYARTGRRMEALAIVDTIERRVRTQGLFFPDYDVACVFGALGDRDAAFAHLERAREAASEALLWVRVDPRADPLRSDLRYAPFLRRSGFVDS